jgi:hypothetical protein
MHLFSELVRLPFQAFRRATSKQDEHGNQQQTSNTSTATSSRQATRARRPTESKQDEHGDQQHASKTSTTAASFLAVAAGKQDKDGSGKPSCGGPSFLLLDSCGGPSRKSPPRPPAAAPPRDDS